MLIVMLACIDFLGVNSMQIAFSSDSSAFLATISYMVVFYGYMIDQLYFHEPMAGFDMVGACLILIVSISVAIYKLKLYNQERAKEMSDEFKKQ